MAFLLRNMWESVVKVVGPQTAGNDDIKEIRTMIDYMSTNRYTLVEQTESIYLLRTHNASRYDVVLVNQTANKVYEGFSLRRIVTENEAKQYVNTIKILLLPICQSSSYIFNKEVLVKFSKLVSSNPRVTAAHVVCSLGIVESLKHPEVYSQLGEACGENLEYPLQTSIRCKQWDCFQQLLLHKIPATHKDVRGNTALHYAAACDARFVEQLCKYDSNVINEQNIHGETSLAYACQQNMPQCVAILLHYGANTDVPTKGLFPVHIASKNNSIDCITSLCTVSNALVNMKDVENGYMALHHAVSKEMIACLLTFGADINMAASDGSTPLHVKCREKSIECVMALLSHMADVNAADAAGNTLLHTATALDDAFLVKAMLVFSADVDMLNNAGESARHIAATKRFENILNILHLAGSARCASTLTLPTCNAGCRADATFNGLEQAPSEIIPQIKPNLEMYDEACRDMAVSRVMSDTDSRGSKLLHAAGGDTHNTIPVTGAGRNKPYRLLSLDGGGIRGLVLIQVLLAIERASNKPILESFDWIAGTSTGGILALAIASGKTLKECLCLYFRFKDKVFTGNRPYCSEALEQFLQQEFGSRTLMTDMKGIKVVLTGVLADRDPAVLHMFRNYEMPAAPVNTSSSQHYHEPWFVPPLPPSEQLVWRAARSTGAAPTYFNAWGRFVDGGIIANNPTLDLLTEVEEYNQALRSIGYVHELRDPGVVVSAGTGKSPVRPVSTVELTVPNSLWSAAKSMFGAKELGALLVEQATSAEGRCVDRARAWCSTLKLPYFRWSPQLYSDIKLDETDDFVLVDVCYQTLVYMRQQQGKSLNHLALILNN